MHERAKVVVHRRVFRACAEVSRESPTRRHQARPSAHRNHPAPLHHPRAARPRAPACTPSPSNAFRHTELVSAHPVCATLLILHCPARAQTRAGGAPTLCGPATAVTAALCVYAALTYAFVFCLRRPCARPERYTRTSSASAAAAASCATPTHSASASRTHARDVLRRAHAAAQRACLRIRACATLNTAQLFTQRARIVQHIGPLTFDTEPHRASPLRAVPCRPSPTASSARTQVTRPPIPIPPSLNPNPHPPIPSPLSPALPRRERGDYLTPLRFLVYSAWISRSMTICRPSTRATRTRRRVVITVSRLARPELRNSLSRERRAAEQPYEFVRF